MSARLVDLSDRRNPNPSDSKTIWGLVKSIDPLLVRILGDSIDLPVHWKDANLAPLVGDKIELKQIGGTLGASRVWVPSGDDSRIMDNVALQAPDPPTLSFVITTITVYKPSGSFSWQVSYRKADSIFDAWVVSEWQDSATASLDIAVTAHPRGWAFRVRIMDDVVISSWSIASLIFIVAFAVDDDAQGIEVNGPTLPQKLIAGTGFLIDSNSQGIEVNGPTLPQKLIAGTGFLIDSNSQGIEVN